MGKAIEFVLMTIAIETAPLPRLSNQSVHIMMKTRTRKTNTAIAALLGVALTLCAVAAQADNAATNVQQQTQQRVAQREMLFSATQNGTAFQRQAPNLLETEHYGADEAHHTSHRPIDSTRVEESSSPSLIKYQSPYMSAPY